MIRRNGFELPISDAHIYQQLGTIVAYNDQCPLHFTVLRCNDGQVSRTYFGLARADNIQDFEAILDYGDKFEAVINWFNSQEHTK